MAALVGTTPDPRALCRAERARRDAKRAAQFAAWRVELDEHMARGTMAPQNRHARQAAAGKAVPAPKPRVAPAPRPRRQARPCDRDGCTNPRPSTSARFCSLECRRAATGKGVAPPCACGCGVPVGRKGNGTWRRTATPDCLKRAQGRHLPRLHSTQGARVALDNRAAKLRRTQRIVDDCGTVEERLAVRAKLGAVVRERTLLREGSAPGAERAGGRAA